MRSGASGAILGGVSARRSFEILDTQDSSFVSFEGRHTHMHVAAVATFEAAALRGPQGGLDIDRIRAAIESRLHLLPRYRQRLAFTPIGRSPVWIDDERFNLEYHARHTSLPRPGDSRRLKALVGRILSQQLDREKPLWEIWIVEGLEPDRLAMIAKVHHCMVDGVAGVSLMTQLLSASPDARVEAARRWRPRPAPGALQLLAGEAARALMRPAALAARALGQALRRPGQAAGQVAESVRAMQQALRAGLRPVPPTPLNRPIGTHRRVEWQTFDLAELKELRKRLGGSLNDVVLALVAGALRRFLQGRRTPLRGLEYRVVVPVDMRAGAEPDAWLGNRVSAWFVSLPVAVADPRERFRRIHAETSRLKASKAAEGIDLFTRIVDWTGSPLLTRAGVRLASRMHPYNLIVTNVPGPQRPLYLLGARMLEFYPQLPLFENQGLGVATMSYDGRVFFGLVADWDLAPDLSRLAESLRTALTELREAAGAR